MRIFVKAKPLAKEEKIVLQQVQDNPERSRRIEKVDEGHFVVWVKEPPKQGKANKAIIRKLAKYFHVSVYQVILKSGFSSKNKIFEIKL
ncbi:MAG: hypothetical protein COT33_01425 [Candidatus Nealsonbacteria bacterium CG08_land_8_20_14_0_20_38_20]|uniref:Uncharacterized protein n=1 Tax=Candidatus Nealsonbacteria bacterium CG08_land_8_20_14_0_20_38_20 TaxID=1974705 RepID=A0A2H0YM53_9BACT|nr:MAG: hypothetical protein COT33_01425 [Candidatus Nealsonbacteria bacterium CG08_land_8_20_14_0_20_38_20]